MNSKKKISHLKPVLKWVGGKRQLLSEILPLIPSDYSKYCEPFIGGGAVLLAHQPTHAVINDYNPELINVYMTIRDNLEELLELLKKHESKNSSEYFYEVRAMDRTPEFSDLNNIARAARVMYLNKTCFNGLFRVNSLGQLNVPYGKYKKPNIVNEESLRALSEYLNGDIELCCGDYAVVLASLPENSFVYLDPPYMPISQTSAFTGYTQVGFNYDEQVRLRDECLKLKERGIHFVQSNSGCEAIYDLYKDFDIKIVKAKRSINAKGDGRGAVDEVLISG